MKSDHQIKNDVVEELKWVPSVTDTDIGVSVHDGVVTLNGTVPNFAEKKAAERAVLRVEGVRAIADEIKVKLPDTLRLDDESIANEVSKALEMNVNLPLTIKPMVENGRVTLVGTVSFGFLRDLALKTVRHIRGVRDVNNHIIIKPELKPKDIRARVRSALRRIAEQNSDKIEILTDGGKVVLKGKVHSVSELEDIKWAAWAAPGVSEVESMLVVAKGS